MIRKVLAYCFLSLGLVLSGCMEEKPDACEIGVTLKYVYTLHNEGGDRFAEEVEHLHIYVYDGNGVLVQERNLPRTSLEGGNTTTFVFDASGEYTFVTWGNVHSDDFFIETTRSTTDMKLTVACVDDNNTLTTTEPTGLFHGMVTLEVRPGLDYTQQVELMKNTKSVRIEFNGIEDVFGTELDIRLTGRNGMYFHDNTIHADSPEITYLSEQWIDNGYKFAKVPTFRVFENDSELILSVHSTKPTSEGITYSYEEPLVNVLLEKINSNHQNYLDKTDLFIVYIDFDDEGMGSASTVRSWDDVGNETGL